MAGEIYIARQDTLENVQSTVNEIDANVDTANSTLGNFAGGGTDSVVTELNALKQAVAALTTKTDGLQTDVTNIKTDVGTIETAVEQIASAGGGIKRVQRGVIESKECKNGDPMFSNESCSFINLQTPINPEKSFLLLYSSYGYNDLTNEDHVDNIVGRIYSTTQIVIYANTRNRSGTRFIKKVCWEVIEFN